jgi:threonine dehydrogenase-like Zn-dependent dehydrogenase
VITDNVFAVGEDGNLTAAWFWTPALAAPPTDAVGIGDLLDRSQRRTFAALQSRLRPSRSCPAVLLWKDAGHLNALAVEIKRAGAGRFSAEALEVARTDASVLRLRSGPDAPALAGVTVAVFGVGAIGSEIAMLLARSGVKRLVLVDHERLRPSNLSRHAASGRTIGMRKSVAMAATIREALPDTDVDAIDWLLWSPDQIEAIARQAHLVVDATGNRAYRDLLSRIAAMAGVLLLAAALHRGGRIARVRIQVGDTDPLWGRSEATGFPEIPTGPGAARVVHWETGCGAPVNNAPPVAVAAAAALATRCALDLLTNRDVRNRDVVEIFDPIAEEPFDARGTLTFEARSA